MLSIIYNVCHSYSIMTSSFISYHDKIKAKKKHLFNTAAVYDELSYMLYVMFSY